MKSSLPMLLLLANGVAASQTFHFPLHVGDHWQTNYIRIDVTGDTVLENAKYYFTFQEGRLTGSLDFKYFVREESSKVYFFQPPYDSSERLRYDFTRSVHDTLWEDTTAFGVLQAITTDTVFGVDRSVYEFRECSDAICFFEERYRVADSIGMIYRIFYPGLGPPIWDLITGAIIDGKGYGTLATTARDAPLLPSAFALSQNYPNPFNPSTTIRYELPRAAHVSLGVFDLLGRRVASLVEGHVAAGVHTAAFEAGTLPSGVYIYRLQADRFSASRAMVVLK